MLGNFVEISSIVGGTIGKEIWALLPKFAFLGVILTFLIFVVSKFNLKSTKTFKICGGVIPLIALIIIFAPNKAVKTFMLTKVYDKDKAKDYRHNSQNMQYYSEYSMLRRNVC